MPYIKPGRREDFHKFLEVLAGRLKEKGEYNYAITYLLHSYIQNKGLRYEHLNDAIGIIECVKQEFYRTVAAKYEDQKRRENGAVSRFGGEE